MKLFHSGADANDAVASNLPVYCENYEEIVFQDPTVVMRDLLVKNPIPYVSGEWKHHTDCKFSATVKQNCYYMIMKDFNCIYS